MTTLASQPRLASGMPLPLLLAKAARHGADGLERRHLVILGGLANLLPHHSAAGRATVGQVAHVTRFSPRWTRHTLGELEEMGLVGWSRGGVRGGVPQPGVLRVAKEVLCDLIQAGRAEFRAALLAQQAATRARVAGKTFRPKHKRRSRPTELSAYLSPFGEVTGPPGAPVGPASTADSVRRFAEQARKVLREARRAARMA